jgi:hypothetical protein
LTADYLALSSGHYENTKKPCVSHDRGGGLGLGLGRGGLFLGPFSYHYVEPAGHWDRCDAQPSGCAACRVAGRWRPDPSAKLTAMGFSKVLHLSPNNANQRYFRDRRDGLSAATMEQMMRAIV